MRYLLLILEGVLHLKEGFPERLRDSPVFSGGKKGPSPEGWTRRLLKKKGTPPTCLKGSAPILGINQKERKEFLLG